MPRYELNEPAVVAETIDGEAVVINLERGIYFSIKDCGLAIWTDMLSGEETSAIADRLRSHFGTQHPNVDEEVASFIKQLIDEQLVRPRLRPSDGTALAALDAGYSAPTLDKYTDMEALLLLDPIHDVDEAGWPTRS
jgi:hypothetical protein